jgi:hypothetical protein
VKGVERVGEENRKRERRDSYTVAMGGDRDRGARGQGKQAENVSRSRGRRVRGDEI